LNRQDSPFDRWWVGAWIAATVVLAFWPMTHQSFLGGDDFEFIRDNPHVRAGLTWEGARWAFANLDARMWTPLTWLSYMIEAQLHGIVDGDFLLTNLLLHAASAWLLFEFLRRASGEAGPSAAAVLLWALHPMRVESIRSAGKRMDPLSLLFCMATLLAYLWQTRRPTMSRKCACWLAYLCAVMTKPSVVTLPFAFLLLDFWPLRRWSQVPLKTLLMEKAPLFAMAVLGAVIAPIGMRDALKPLESLPLSLRLRNVPYSYVKYLAKTLWPVGLPLYYPHPGATLTAAAAGACLVLLALITAAAWRLRSQAPYLAVGWAWFLGTLVPMIEIVQTFTRGMANHFTYIPHIGLAIAAAWGLSGLLGRPASLARLRPALAAVLVVALAARVRAELWYSRDLGALFEYTLAYTTDNYYIEGELGQYYSGLGRLDLAESHLREAVRIHPHSASAHVNMGALFAKTGRPEAAEREFREALELDGSRAAAAKDLALLLVSEGRSKEAEPELRRALVLSPNDAELLGNLAEVRFRLGDVAGALAGCRMALEFDPASAELHNNLGIVLAAAGQANEAGVEFRKALELRSDFPEARRNLDALGAKGADAR
jgi:protein O-mannosyl-transferase